MDLTTPVQTSYGQVPLQELLNAYEKKKLYEKNKAEWFKTDEGKAYNRQKSKEYYQRHREDVLLKRAARYEVDHDELLNRAKQYYATHNEEILEKNKRKREAKQQKIEGSTA